jgi:hypothetical protein
MTDHAIRLILASLRYIKVALSCGSAQQTSEDQHSSKHPSQDIAAFANGSQDDPAAEDPPDRHEEEAIATTTGRANEKGRRSNFEDRPWSLDSGGFALVLVVVLLCVFSVASSFVGGNLMTVGA